MSYEQALQYLYDLNLFGAKLGLENTRALCHLAGNPEKSLRFIHVAGTNGKGSTCAILESVYRHQGYKTGLFTSPHLVEFGERIQVNRVPISHEKIVQLVDRVKDLLKNSPLKPTFFEVVTLMALLVFKEENCKIILWETGLGGRLDATNVVSPLASLITNISLEHQQYLGDTIGKIAYEKAGIIKPNRLAVTTEKSEEALSIIRQKALECNAPLTIIEDTSKLFVQFRKTYNINSSFSNTSYQRDNIVLALKTVELLRKDIPISQDAIQQGLHNTRWDGRFQIFHLSDKQILILDGSHNIGGFTALKKSLETFRPNEKPVCILGVLADKNWQEICKLIAPLCSRFIAITVPSPRALPAEELTTAIRQYLSDKSAVSTANDFQDALNKVANDPYILVCGSLYLIGTVIQKLRQEKTSPTEANLNHWRMRS